MELNQQNKGVRELRKIQRREKIVFPTPRRIKREIENLDKRRAARNEVITDLRELFDRR